jgi:hypothetical protein
VYQVFDPQSSGSGRVGRGFCAGIAPGPPPDAAGQAWLASFGCAAARAAPRAAPGPALPLFDGKCQAGHGGRFSRACNFHYIPHLSVFGTDNDYCAFWIQSLVPRMISSCQAVVKFLVWDGCADLHPYRTWHDGLCAPVVCFLIRLCKSV